MTYFGKPAVYMGEGGTIPFMGMLGEKFPDAQFLITGLLGPGSNAHGPNEFLHIPTGKKLTACVAHLLMAHALCYSAPTFDPLESWDINRLSRRSASNLRAE